MSELYKALSLIAPIGMLAVFFETNWVHNAVKSALALGVGAVLVPSFSYHSLCHFGKLEDLIDNKARRLDQSGQHVANALIAFALSGCPIYFAAVSTYSISGIALLWLRGEHDKPFYRRAFIFFTICLSLAPMVWRRDYPNLVGAAATLAVMIPLFARGGTCHSVSHLLLAPYIYFIYKSADVVAVHFDKVHHVAGAHGMVAS